MRSKFSANLKNVFIFPMYKYTYEHLQSTADGYKFELAAVPSILPRVGMNGDPFHFGGMAILLN